MINVVSGLFRNNKDYGLGITNNLKAHLNRTIDPFGHTILICSKGEALVSLYSTKYLVREGIIISIYREMLPRILKATEDFECFYFVMSNKFDDEISHNIPVSYFNKLVSLPLLTPSVEEKEMLQMWMKQVVWFSRDETNIRRDDIIKNYIRSLFYYIENELRKLPEHQNHQSQSSGNHLLHQFYKLVIEHCREHHDVTWYAEQLLITPYYLSTITMKYEGLSPKKLIDNQIITEINTLLRMTDYPLKEIASLMHFPDTSYMCRYFRRKTGMSFNEYRKNIGD